VAVLLVFDRATYTLQWAREIERADVQAACRVSRHVNGHLLTAAAAARLGIEVTSEFGQRDRCHDQPG
jgi:hypothetical protein